MCLGMRHIQSVLVGLVEGNEPLPECGHLPDR